LKYKRVVDSGLIYVLNNIERSVKFKNSSGDFFINVYIVSDPTGSAHIEGSEEISDSIYIAVSEDGKVPDQYLYRLTSVYDPKIISYTKSVKHPQLILAYGPANKRRRVAISIELKKCKLNNFRLKSAVAHSSLDGWIYKSGLTRFEIRSLLYNSILNKG
jgi:hypothetical protein